jgi:CRP/FNR family transcriptional regulator
MGDDLCRCRKLAGPKDDLHPRCFGQIWLFDGLPHDAWESFAGDLLRRKFLAGEDLFRQGDEADTMWLIKSGSVKLWKNSEDGRVLTLDIRKSGDLLGENVLTGEGTTYPVSATSIGETLTCGIDRRTFESIVTKYPTVGLVVIRNLSRRIDQLSGKLGALSEISLEDRLYEVLVNVARDVGKPAPGGWIIAFPLTHEEIGFLVGAHRVSVTRALGRLRDTGRVRAEGKFIFLRDAASPD